MTNNVHKSDESQVTLHRNNSDIESSAMVHMRRGRYGGVWFDGDTPQPEFPLAGTQGPSPAMPEGLKWEEWWEQNCYYVLDCQNRSKYGPTVGASLRKHGRFAEKAYYDGLAYEYDVTPLTTEQYEQIEQVTSVPLNRQFRWRAGFRVKTPPRVP